MKVPRIGLYKVQSILSREFTNLRVKLCGILYWTTVSITTDNWTSCNKITLITYVYCTLPSLEDLATSSYILGAFPESHAHCLQRIWCSMMKVFGKSIFSNVLILLVVLQMLKPQWSKLPKFFWERAEQKSIKIDWHGCIDHLLNLDIKFS
jgi:hypothetical protein